MDLQLKLVHSKYAFRKEHLTTGEEYLWIQHLEREGFDSMGPDAIFKPMVGESREFLKEVSATDELRVRSWIWTDVAGMEHPILDMYTWAGFGESGFVALDGKVVLSTADVPSEFDINLFLSIRGNFATSPFFETEPGQAALQIEDAARDQFDQAHAEIKQEHCRLRDAYLSEFKVTSVVSTLDPSKAEEICVQIDYTSKIRDGEIIYPMQFVFIEWDGLQLVTVRYPSKDKTYLLNSNGEIDRYVYDDDYLVDVWHPKDQPMALLMPRIHAYLATYR